MGILAESEFAGGIFSGVFLLIWIALYVIFIVGAWKMYEKAGQPGWACIIPFYNIYILLKIAGRPGWWLVFIIFPPAWFIAYIFVAIDLAKSFGKTTAFAIGLYFLGPIFTLILGFGPATYQGPAGPEGSSIAPPPPTPA